LLHERLRRRSLALLLALVGAGRLAENARHEAVDLAFDVLHLVGRIAARAAVAAVVALRTVGPGLEPRVARLADRVTELLLCALQVQPGAVVDAGQRGARIRREAVAERADALPRIGRALLDALGLRAHELRAGLVGRCLTLELRVRRLREGQRNEQEQPCSGEQRRLSKISHTVPSYWFVVDEGGSVLSLRIRRETALCQYPLWGHA